VIYTPHFLARLTLLCALFLFVQGTVYAQIGGKNAFQFLQLPTNTHAAGLGIENVSVLDRSVGLVSNNPALLSDTMKGDVMMMVNPYYAGIFHSQLQLATRIGTSGLWSFGLTYVNYGKMDETLPDGTVIGTFNPNEFALSATKSHTIGLFSLGGTLKLAASQVADYNAAAVLLDMGGVFKHPIRDWTVGLVVKNVGFPINNYTKDQDITMPFDIQLGTTLKPEHLPLRISLTAQKLYQYNISYYDPALNTQTSFDGTETSKEDGILLQGFRHMVIGTEVLLGKNFNVRLGYNALIRRELRLESKAGAAGFSWGFMLRIKKFEFTFTRAYYRIAGGTNYIGIVLNTSDLFSKKRQ